MKIAKMIHVLHRSLPRSGASRGYTLIEIAVVIGIIAIVAGLGIATMREFTPRYKLVQASKELKADVSALRMMAIEENRQTRLLLADSDPDYLDASTASRGSWYLQIGNRARNSTRWDTLPVDVGADADQSEGFIDISIDGTRPLKGVSLMPWGSFTGPGTRNADAIVFTPRGWVENPASDFASEGYIILTLINKAARADNINDYIEVRIARSGLVDLEASMGRDPDGNSVGTGATTSGAFFRGVQ